MKHVIKIVLCVVVGITSIPILFLFLVPHVKQSIKILFPTPPITQQLKDFNPAKIMLPNDLRPEVIEVGSQNNQFIVYAASIYEVNPRLKAIFLIDSDGNILDRKDVNPECQTPITIKDVGLVLPYCALRTDQIYVIGSTGIEVGKSIPAQMYDYTSPDRIKHERLDSRGDTSYLSDQITYRHRCEDNWGSCFFVDMLMSMNGREIRISDYYLHDYLELDSGRVVTVFGSNATNYNETNELIILNTVQ